MINYSAFLQKESFVIFLFHGVISQERHGLRNYTRKHLTLETFTAIVSSLCKEGNPVSMEDIVRATNRKASLPDRAFAITFDDGFLNNFTVAAPVLRRFQIPAMVYATSSFIDLNRMSWIDQIEYAVELCDSIELNNAIVQGRYETVEQKIELLNRIRQLVKSNPQIDPYAFAQEICDQLGVDEIKPDPELDQKMNWEQLKELDSETLFTVGGHSHTHRILAYLSRAELQFEITTSIELLQRHLERPITHYSYPEGLSYCYSDDVIFELERSGVLCSPTAEYGVNIVGDDLFRLKRILVE